MNPLLWACAVLYYLLLCGGVAAIAQRLGRSGMPWFVVSLLLSPVAGVILLLALALPPVAPREGEPSEEEEPGMRLKCPKCAAEGDLSTGEGVRRVPEEPWRALCAACGQDLSEGDAVRQ